MASACSVSASASSLRPSCQRRSPILRRMFRWRLAFSRSRLIRSAVLSARSAALNRFSRVRTSPSRKYASASRADGPAAARCAVSRRMIFRWRTRRPIVSHARSCWNIKSARSSRDSSSSGRCGQPLEDLFERAERFGELTERGWPGRRPSARSGRPRATLPRVSSGGRGARPPRPGVRGDAARRRAPPPRAATCADAREGCRS